jgi:CBS domain-containing protein
MLVEQLMTREVEACRPDSTLAAVADIMWRRDCGVVPVVDKEGRVVGVVTDRDICIALASRGQTAHEVGAAEVMSREVHACTADDDVDEALALMRRARVRRLPVLDGQSKLAGVLSLRDVILNARRGGGKRHVSRGDAFRTMRAVSRPHGAPADDAPDEADHDEEELPRPKFTRTRQTPFADMNHEQPPSGKSSPGRGDAGDDAARKR